VIYTKETMQESLEGYLMLYKELGLKKMLSHAKPTNDYQDEDFDENLALDLLNEFIKASVPLINKINPHVNDILFGMTNGIAFLNDYETTLPENIKEALVVDLINYIGGAHGIEIVLMTKDIPTELVDDKEIN